MDLLGRSHLTTANRRQVSVSLPAPWPYTRIGLTSLARNYSMRLASLPSVRPIPGPAGGFAGSTFSIVIDQGFPLASEVAARLAQMGIETRRWWANGCHAQSAFAGCPVADLPVTRDLARRALGLPFHLDVGQREINVVVGALADALVMAGPGVSRGIAS